jgi:hypothetical protein
MASRAGSLGATAGGHRILARHCVCCGLRPRFPLKWAGPRNLAGVNNWEGAFRAPTVTPPSIPEYCCLPSPDIRLCLGNVLEPSLKQSGSFMALY